MDEENFNEALYLYNALIEYIYFLIALIEAEGPRSLVNVEKHLKFFNHDIYGFAKMFNGEDLAEQIGTMLCTTTSIFGVENRFLNLLHNAECFKRTLYKELLISKIVDAVVRGISCVKDVCHNLNLNNTISIEEKSLITVLKKCPYFFLDSNNLVIVRQFHGLLGFEDHVFKTVVRYFQSYLQNINVLTYSEVIFHEKFIPTCAISNPLFLFCTLHVCSIFKCEKGKVKLRKKFRKKKCGNQVINIENLSLNPSESIPIGLLVSKALGSYLHNWTGEISEIKKSAAQIQCVVSFSNEFQGIFVIHMYKTALKHICETEDLNDYLSIRDIVEFDAIYCDEAVDQRIFWQATCIRVIKQSLKKSKFELDVDIDNYFEKIKLNSNSFNIIPKTCNLRNCRADFIVLEKNLSVISKNKSNAVFSSKLDTELSLEVQSSISEKSSNLSRNSSDCLMSKSVMSVNQSLPLAESNEENLRTYHDAHNINLTAVKKDSNQTNVMSKNESNGVFSSELDTESSLKLQSLVSEKSNNLSQNSSDCLMNKAIMSGNQSLPLKYIKDCKEGNLLVCHDVHDINSTTVKKDSNPNNLIPKNKNNSVLSSELYNETSLKLESLMSENLSNFSQNSSDFLINKVITDANESLPLMNSHEENLHICHDVHGFDSTALKKDSNQNSIIISDPLFLNSSFMFGEVSVTSEEDGIAVTINSPIQYNVFFKSEAVFSQNAKRIPAKGSIVLLFIPHLDSEDSYCVATLLYPLNSEESVLCKENVNIESYVMDKFFPIVQRSLSDIHSCFCSLKHTLAQKLLITQKYDEKRKHLNKILDFIKNLQEVFCFSEISATPFYVLVNELYSYHWGISCTKLSADLILILVQAFSLTNCSKKLKVLRKKRNFNNFCQKRNYSTSHFLSHMKKTYSKTSDVAISSFKEKLIVSVLPKSGIKEEILLERKSSSPQKTDDARFDTTLLQVNHFFEQDHGSCISISSYKSCNSKSSDDVYYSCESLPDKFDSLSDKNENSLLNQSNGTCSSEENDCKNIAINSNEVNDLPPLDEKNSDLCDGPKDIPIITLNTLHKKFAEKCELIHVFDFKINHSSLSKAKRRRNKHKIILPSSCNHCKKCWNSVIETTACISTITDSCLYFFVKYNEQAATLGFPRHLVSKEVLESLSLGSNVKIGVIPNTLLQFSDVLYINLC